MRRWALSRGKEKIARELNWNLVSSIAFKVQFQFNCNLQNAAWDSSCTPILLPTLIVYMSEIFSEILCTTINPKYCGIFKLIFVSTVAHTSLNDKKTWWKSDRCLNHFVSFFSMKKSLKQKSWVICWSNLFASNMMSLYVEQVSVKFIF